MKMTTIGYPISHLDTNLRKGTTFLLLHINRKKNKTVKFSSMSFLTNCEYLFPCMDNDLTAGVIY
jgi:hypothetical protein